jgi:sugar O-acyltransferase (sialic acid O-acetyltransferase NeuD family)
MRRPREDIVVFGTGSFAAMIDAHLGAAGHARVVAFTATEVRTAPDTFRGRPLVPFDEVGERFAATDHRMFVAVGYSQHNDLRARFCEEARARGYKLATFISPNADVWDDVVVADNCAILSGALIEPGVELAHDVVVWTGAYIGHGSSIGEHAFIGPRAAIAGGTRVGRNCFVGANATIRDGVTIGERCVVGAGATILHDTPPSTVWRAAAT